MNTIHSAVDQRLTINTDYRRITEILCEQQDYVRSETDLLLQNSVFGFAVKLSRLHNFGLGIADVLSVARGKIIIDAEYNRLDGWLVDHLDEGHLRPSDLDRLMVTVQVKRQDALDQIQVLSELEIQTVLVSGNRVYLNAKEQKTSASHKFAEILKTYSYDILGITRAMKQKIEQLTGFHLPNSNILELQGYQELEQSKLWTYFAGSSLSEEAQQYLKRRSNRGTYLATTIEDLLTLAQKHHLVLFVDGNNSYQYLHRIDRFSRLVG